MNTSIPKTTLRCSAILAIAFLVSCGGGGGGGGDSPAAPTVITPVVMSKVELGASVFADKNLSFNRTQSCATCHNPASGFIDDRLDAFGEIGAVSLGDDGISLGDRNAPSIAYSQFSPEFEYGSHPRFNSQQPDYSGFIGGQFHDGRSVNLEAQAGEPPLGALEMGMPDRESVVERLLENEDYRISFKALFGDAIFDDSNTAYAAMTQAIAEFERSDEFSAFDSLYDRDTIDPLSKAALGKALFFSQQFSNCATCHQLSPNGSSEETFSNYEYHNIGVPVNEAVRAVNGIAADHIDDGLLSNPAVTDIAERGKYKVPTLRNIAVTGPYMHNGVFRDLRTVIEFYDHFLSGSQFNINPETGSPWRAPQLPSTVSLVELQEGRTLNNDEVEAMVCFLRALTDQRYEHLIEEKGISCQ